MASYSRRNLIVSCRALKRCVSGARQTKRVYLGVDPQTNAALILMPISAMMVVVPVAMVAILVAKSVLIVIVVVSHGLAGSSQKERRKQDGCEDGSLAL